MPICVPAEEPCSFCCYLRGDRRYTILDRGDAVAMLVTFEQRGQGHVLVVPIEHRETLFELTSSEASAVIRTTIRAARAIRAAFDPDGIAVWQNNGVAAHQSVPHVHMHVAGTLPTGGTAMGRVPRLTIEQTDSIADRLRPFLT